MSSKKSDKFPYRLIFTEIALYILVALAWYIAKESLNLSIENEYLIDGIFIFGFIGMVIRKNAHHRFYWYAFSAIVLSAISDTLGATTITFYFSSLAISFLILGVLNTLLFNKNFQKANDQS
ncbi:MAG: hypothetical protein UT39_C0003G0006 [Candidatus Woesebacteria bacterium GW2011_GWA1_39_21]|uniref:Integral membrane protein n=1 Tax=Candidatus Woesebacteria bacterium GW2011_GWA1_39_21 TaxID=1618550 RepID=A0A0G0RDK1_9BACT|nr:MAG: hypothetical protein UT39_C0003G0006 [Candidatus Woesebacteria bacterium GW2011_GWA1_39_21]